MTWESVVAQIEDSLPYEPIDEVYKTLFTHFLAQYEDASFSRSTFPGHITASAVVVNEKFNQMLLMHHKKLNIWLQFGGHADGNPDILEVAKKELSEESGIEKAHVVSEKIFDLAIHEIPERKNEPEHLHFDIRYLFVVPSNVSFEVNKDEGHDVRWFALDTVNSIEKCWLERVVKKVDAVKTKKYLV